MATLTIPVCPKFPYSCYINFWDYDGHFDFYRTLIATAESTIISAKLQFQIHVPNSGTKRIFEWFINDHKVYSWSSVLTGIHEARITGEVDISDYILPIIGYAGEGTNKITFGCHNPWFPLAGITYDIDYAYLVIEYTSTTPTQPTENPTESSGTGLFGIENIDQIFASMMQLMITMMIMSMMMSMMEAMI